MVRKIDSFMAEFYFENALFFTSSNWKDLYQAQVELSLDLMILV